MKSGYEIKWTNHALSELASTFEYLEDNFTEKELKNLSVQLEKTLTLISITPTLFPLTEFHGVRKVVIKKFNTLYYRNKEEHIEIISFFSNRQKPVKRLSK